jgi:hypothetical protein
VVPGAVDGFVDLLSGEVIIFGGQPVQTFIAGQDALQEINGQECTFGVDGQERRAVSGLHDYSPQRRKERQVLLNFEFLCIV